MDTVRSLAFSPDGTMLASGSTDRTAILWDVAGRRRIRVLSGPKETVSNAAVAFSHDGTTVAVDFNAGNSTSVVLWDVNTGESASLLPEGHHVVSGLAFSGDDKLLVIGGRNKIMLWNTTTRQSAAPPILGGFGYVDSVAFLDDGRILATIGSDGRLRFWDVEMREELAAINAHPARILSMALSPDGAVLATASADSTIRLWDTTTRRETARLRGHTSEVRCVAFSSDGTILASASKDRTVKLWVPAPRPDSDTLIGHNRLVTGVVFTVDSQRLISTGFGAPVVICLLRGPVARWQYPRGWN
jgi:WD40 repeat protein